jgi:hypothetical protein
MQQMNQFIYVVDANEVVTVEIVASKVGNQASFVVDGTRPTQTSTSPLTFEFPVTVGPGNTHFGKMRFAFPGSPPQDASYSVFMTGSLGGGRFTGPVIKQSDIANNDTRDFEFRRP